MQENTNRAILFNSVVLYGKTIINTVCALFTTRFALQALGIVDYGLYAVLGGIISIISIFNIIMLSTSNRFIAVAIGRGDMDEANKQFNVNLIVHVSIAIFALIIAYPLGDWYIPRYVNYDGPLSNAMMVFVISVLGSIISFVGVPYNGLLMAREKFIVFSLTDVFIHIIKLAVAWLLVYCFEHKLFIYTLTMSLMTATSTIIYIVYCKRHYAQIVKLCFVRDRELYKKVFGFSAWIAVGAVAHVGKTQGAALIVNAFFNTVMNTAMGVASHVAGYITMLAQNVTQPMAPQITKSYASGNTQRTSELLIMSTKYAFMLTLLIGSMFLVAPEWLLGLWLGEVPPFTTVFLVLFVVDQLVQSLNSGIQNIVFASGKISMYQVFSSTLNIISVVLGFLVLRAGADAYYLVVAYIAVSVLRFFALQFVLHHTLHFNNSILWRKSYIPSILTVVLFVPALFIPTSIHPSIRIITSLFYLCLLECFICFDKSERRRLFSFVKGIISQKLSK